MQTQTIKVGLTINGYEAHVGHKFLALIAGDLLDTPKNKAIFEQLAYSDNPDTRENVASKKSLNKKTVIKLLLDPVQNVAKTILQNDIHVKKIDEETLQKILATDNIELLCEIALYVEDYILCDISSLVKKLSKHSNAKVRHALCYGCVSEVVSVKILQKLALDEDLDVAESARKELKSRLEEHL